MLFSRFFNYRIDADATSSLERVPEDTKIELL